MNEKEQTRARRGRGEDEARTSGDETRHRQEGKGGQTGDCVDMKTESVKYCDKKLERRSGLVAMML